MTMPNQGVRAQPLTPQEIAKLEPEICKPGSSAFQTITGALPFLAGSSSTSMADEQISLIDQYKASGRRKVWVLRVPAAFISYRTCDAGRSNWTGAGDDLSVGQRYQLSLIVGDDRIIPFTRASQQEVERGIKVTIELKNSVTNPDQLHRSYEKRSFVIGRNGVNGPPVCHDIPSDIPELVIFKRVDPAVRAPDCEGWHRNGVYARKLGDRVYDFIVYCDLNCWVERDYQGWDVKYLYAFGDLTRWENIHRRIAEFLDQHTRYIDWDNETHREK